jgi:DNA-binding NarL/FixJ family response regulator
MSRTRILVAEDHEIFRKGLRSLLESHPQFEICGEAANGREAVDAAKRLLPDIIIMDISMPVMNGLEATKVILKESSTARIVVLSQHDSSHMLNAAIVAGASAYVTKSQVARDLLAALQNVMSGLAAEWRRENASAKRSPAELEIKPT